jgi:phosphatidylinositol dimannoside acyltransferase
VSPGRGVPLGARLVDAGYAAGWRMIRALPEGAAWRLFRAAADRAAARPGPATWQLRANLRRVVGADVPGEELDDLVRAGLRSYARYWLEAFRLPTLSREQIRTGFQLEGAHLLGDAVAAGTGCVAALPHAGNWDFAGAWACGQGWPLTTVAERLRPESLYKRFLAYRESLGMHIIPTVGGQRAPLDVLADRLGQAHIVPLLADRDLSSRGVEVQFFGARARMPAGPALLTLRTGAPLFAVSMWYAQGRPCGRVEGPLPVPPSGPLDERVRMLTQTVADHLAEGIAKHPTDWHMLQRLWSDDRTADGSGP